MKSLKWIVLAIMMTTLAFGPGCSKDDEPSVSEFNGSILIQDGKIYIKSYAMKGMKYAPLPKEDLPEFINTRELHMEIWFEGEYEGEHAYWMDFIGSSYFDPWHFSADGKLLDIAQSFREIDHTKLTCIYLGETYAKLHRGVVIIGKE